MRRWPWNGKTAAAASWTPAAWPGDAATVERWLREELRANVVSGSELQLDGVDDIRITAQLDGTDLEHLLIDATGVNLTVQMQDDAQLAAADALPAAVPEIISRTPGMLRTGRLIADPVMVQGFPVHVDATVSDAPVDWAEYADDREQGRPASRFGIEESPGPATSSGSFSVRIQAADIAPLLVAIARPMLATAGVRLRRLECTITVGQRQVVTVHALASARWKIFGVSARATASVQISPDAVVTVKRVRLSSSNPLVAIALFAVRSQVRASEGQRFDLNAEAGPVSPRVHDLRVTAGDDVAIAGRFS